MWAMGRRVQVGWHLVAGAHAQAGRPAGRRMRAGCGWDGAGGWGARAGGARGAVRACPRRRWVYKRSASVSGHHLHFRALGRLQNTVLVDV